MIFAFGDSHTWCPAALHDVLSIHVPQITLHRLGRPGEALNLWNGQSFTGSHDSILIIAGEIDVRAHVGKQVGSRDEVDVIFDLARSAHSAVETLDRHLPVQSYMCGIIPPSREFVDQDLPVVGTIEQRVLWTESLNSVMANMLGARFLMPRWDLFTDSFGALDPQYTDESGFHLRDDFAGGCYEPILEKLL